MVTRPERGETCCIVLTYCMLAVAVAADMSGGPTHHPDGSPGSVLQCFHDFHISAGLPAGRG